MNLSAAALAINNKTGIKKPLSILQIQANVSQHFTVVLMHIETTSS